MQSQIKQCERPTVSYLFTLFYIMGLASLFILAKPSLATDNNPFDSNPKLLAYAKRALQAEKSKNPQLLVIEEVNEQEREDIYQYLRKKLQEPLSVWQLSLLDYPRQRLLRNEISTRHGHVFSSEDLDAYFRLFSWYQPDKNFKPSALTATEVANSELISRLEFIDYHRHESYGIEDYLGRNEIKDIANENKHIAIIGNKVLFKATQKTILINAKIANGAEDRRQTSFETIAMAAGVPVVLKRKWQKEIHVTGATYGVGIEVYDLSGKFLGKIDYVGGELSYAKEMEAFVSRTYEGCCGTQYGSTAIFNKEGKMLYSSTFGYDGGQGSIRYLKPIWSNNLVAWIEGEVIPGNEKDNSPKTHDKMVIFGASGSPIIDIALTSGTIPEAYSNGQGLRQLALIEPDVLYYYATEGKKPSRALVFLKKGISFKPSVGDLYKSKQFGFGSNDFEFRCERQSSHSKVKPIYNPVTAWKKEILVGGINPIMTKRYIVFFEPETELYAYYTSFQLGDPETRARYLKKKFNVKAFDKLTGNQVWVHQTGGLVDSVSLHDSLLAVSYHGGLSLIDANSGNLLWNVVVDAHVDKRPYSSVVLLNDVFVARCSIDDLTCNFYDLKSGAMKGGINLKELDKRINHVQDIKWFNSDISIFGAFTNHRDVTVERPIAEQMLIALDLNFNHKWTYIFPSSGYEPRDFQVGVQENRLCVSSREKNQEFIIDDKTGSQLDKKDSFAVRIPISTDISRVMNTQMEDIASRPKETGGKTSRYKKKETASPCIPSYLESDKVYVKDSYLARNALALYDSCLTGRDRGKDNEGYFRKSYWYYSPWQQNLDVPVDNFIEVLFIDHYSVLVEVRARSASTKRIYWMIIEDALYDYANRRRSLPGNSHLN